MQQYFAYTWLRKAMLGMVVFGLPSVGLAAGFQIQEQNASNLGLAYSGTAAFAQDSSTAFYNAAGLTRLKEKQLVVSGVAIQSSAKMSPISAIHSFNGVMPSNTFYDDDPGGVVPVPSLHYGARITDKLVFGLSLAAPFGLQTSYSAISPARYVATRSKLVTIDLSPSLAYQVDPQWSIGAGVDIQRGKVHLDTAIGSNILATDGFLKHELSAIGYGYHMGVLYEPTAQARLGLHYRSKINYHGVGDYTIFAAGLFDQKGKVNAQITLPEAVLFSGYYEFLPCLAVLFDAHWTRWERFEQLELKYATMLPTGRTSSLVHENFKNTLRLALGLNYQLNDEWTYRIGVAWDESPTRTPTRTARIPDEDRIWLSVGSHYRYNAQLSFDFGYSHLFFKKAWVDDHGPVGSAANYVGSYKAYANLFGLQVNWDFN